LEKENECSVITANSLKLFMAKMKAASSVDEYIAAADPLAKKALKDIRKSIKAAAPKAEEVISYQIPGYKYHGMLVFFAAWKGHISLYPAPWTAESLKKEMSAYEGSKGTIKFPLDKPMPLLLIKKMVKYRVKENEARAAIKKSIKNASKSKKVKTDR
jgi:uncharacterized protein YdhG (YjbR/CyaY superfamily)